jgi:hypothetical protein
MSRKPEKARKPNNKEDRMFLNMDCLCSSFEEETESG